MFSALQLQQAAGLSYRQIDYWCRMGILVPVGNPMPGSGAEPRRFTNREVMVAAVLGELRGVGALGPALRRVGAQLRRKEYAGVVYVHPSGRLSAVPLPVCWRLDLDTIAARVPLEAA